MSNSPRQQGQKDAQQGNGARNTHGWHHQDANSYNASFKSAQKK